MSKKNSVKLQDRKLSITMEAKSGTINLFYGFLNEKKIISGEGSKKQEWSGKVSENSKAKLKIRVTGIGNATYELGIDLPGTLEDQKITFKLTGGYHETEILI